MKYPIAIEPGDESLAWSVVVPDLPGCFSAADSGIDEAIENAKEAIELWIETALDAGEDVPKPSSIATFQKKREFKGWVWAIAEIRCQGKAARRDEVGVYSSSCDSSLTVE